MDNNILEYRIRILNKIFQCIPLTDQLKVIDIGCGDGGDCELLSMKLKEIVGIDIDFNPKWPKSENAKIAFSVADICNLPFPGESFELVFEKDVLHHIEDKIKALKEILRITKEGGYIVCIEGNRYNPIFYFHMTLLKGHDHFTKSFFTQLMKTFSKNPKFLSVESRVYPIKNKRLLKLIHHFEDLVEAFPFIRDYSCYNISIIKKEIDS
jgi:ubiquinone/menaquinone biosynthesis C-methylase UbiE